MHSDRISLFRSAVGPSRLAALAIVALGVGGCLPMSEWRPSETQRQGNVELVQLDHWVGFAPGEETLSTNERARLDRFLETVDLGYGDSITVAVAGQREIARTRAKLVQAPPTHPESVPVAVARYVVTPPRCPDWTKNATQDLFNTPSSDSGCANAYNHALMVADPGDLVRGRRVGPGDGEALALGAERYRKGEIRDLLREEFETRE
jgi:pilus assembly protein CpaD